MGSPPGVPVLAKWISTPFESASRSAFQATSGAGGLVSDLCEVESMRGLLFALGVGIILVALYTSNAFFGPGSAGQRAAGGPGLLVGAPAQSFPVRRLDGAVDSLDSYRGHVVLVNLWASWCTPCRSETPALQQLYRENRERGLVVLGIDQGESATAAGAFAREHALDYPILLDEEQRYGRAYAALGLPTTLVVGKDGHIVRGVDGEMTLAQMRDAVKGPLSI
jgi:peroxiredoxin